MVPNHEILGAQHFSLYEKKKCFSSCPNAKGGDLWHPGASRAQSSVDKAQFRHRTVNKLSL